jgi:hypothetical protein
MRLGLAGRCSISISEVVTMMSLEMVALNWLSAFRHRISPRRSPLTQGPKQGVPNISDWCLGFNQVLSTVLLHDVPHSILKLVVEAQAFYDGSHREVDFCKEARRSERERAKRWPRLPIPNMQQEDCGQPRHKARQPVHDFSFTVKL